MEQAWRLEYLLNWGTFGQKNFILHFAKKLADRILNIHKLLLSLIAIALLLHFRILLGQ